MYSSMCFMSVVTLLVTDMRTGALEENDIQPNQCYNCYANKTTSCEQSNHWASVMCPIKRPFCATTISAPDFQSSLICASALEKPCIVENTNLNSSFVMTCVCASHLCNAPFIAKWRSELLGIANNNTDVRQQDTYELLLKFTNVSEDKLYKAITAELTKSATIIVRTSSQSFASVPSPVTINMPVVSKDTEKPRAESLKQEPTVPSDDDEDESEGSGSYDESKIHNRPVSAPAAPSSYLPANDISASVFCKDLLIFILLIYLFV